MASASNATWWRSPSSRGPVPAARSTLLLPGNFLGLGTFHSRRLVHLLAVRTLTCAWILQCLCLASWPANAAHTHVDLLLAAETARPGDQVEAGVRLQMEPHWHTYWKNPGGSGIPTKVEWDLPSGVTAEELQWPVPEKLGDDDLTTYIYQDEVTLLTRFKLDPALPAGPLRIKAKVSWLECNQLCLPSSARTEATLSIAATATPSSHAALLDAAQHKLPLAPRDLAARAWWETGDTTNARPLRVQWKTSSTPESADFYPASGDTFELLPNTERVDSEPGSVSIRLQVRKLKGNWPTELSGLVVQQTKEARAGYPVKFQVAESGPANLASSPAPTTSSEAQLVPAPALWRMLIYAFIGGLILNIMPCVLPVIALKILGFVGQGKSDPRRVRQLGLIYGLGVLFSFVVLAGLVIGIRAAGHRAGWGMQFGNPQFLVLLTLLVTLVALNLFGLFEINPGGRVLDAAGSLAARQGAAGAFFNGVLATVLATPCTAPFLGAALGFAFTQPPALMVLMFCVVGLGLAAPYVVLSWKPGWLKFLPRPGAWMEHFKVAMGFPMLATAVWLFSLVPIHYGERSWWLAVFLVILALAAWIFGQFFQRGRARRGWALATTFAVILIGYAAVLEGQLHWRSPAPPPIPGTLAAESADGIPWQRWSPAAVTEARAQGRPVLVDFTADWCLTCQVNKKVAIDVPSVRSKLKAINALPLLGDYTRFPDDITAELNRYGRAGVPLVLVFPRGSGQPQILPEALTPGIVLEALDKAVH